MDWTVGVGLCSEAGLTDRGAVLSGLGWRSRRLRCRADSSLVRPPWCPAGFLDAWLCLCSLPLPRLHTVHHTVLSSSQPCAWLPSPGPLPQGLLCLGTLLAHGHQCDVSLCRRVFAMRSQYLGCLMTGRHAGQIHFMPTVWPMKEIYSLC